MIHGVDKQRKDRREKTPQESRRRHRARRIPLKGVDQIIQRGLEDGEEAEPQHPGPDTRRHPRVCFGRRPPEDEEPRREEHGSDHHGREPRFGDGPIAIGCVPAIVVSIIGDVDTAPKDNTRQDGQERQGPHERVPAATFLEGNGEGGQGGVEESVAEGGVDGDGEADGGGEHLEGTDAEFVEHFFQGDVPFFEAGVEAPVSGRNAQAAGFVNEEAGRVGLVEDEDVEDEDGHLEYAG